MMNVHAENATPLLLSPSENNPSNIKFNEKIVLSPQIPSTPSDRSILSVKPEHLNKRNTWQKKDFNEILTKAKQTTAKLEVDTKNLSVLNTKFKNLLAAVKEESYVQNASGSKSIDEEKLIKGLKNLAQQISSETSTTSINARTLSSQIDRLKSTNSDEVKALKDKLQTYTNSQNETKNILESIQKDISDFKTIVENKNRPTPRDMSALSQKATKNSQDLLAHHIAISPKGQAKPKYNNPVGFQSGKINETSRHLNQLKIQNQIKENKPMRLK